MNYDKLASDSKTIFERIRMKSGMDFREITKGMKTHPKKLRGNVVDLIKQDLIWCERQKPWVLGKYYLTSKAEHWLSERNIQYDEADFD